tara:strand:+ start:525 stop:2048 length:1524 start_codon:yes stop_codon:yes gene_type:complete
MKSLTEEDSEQLKKSGRSIELIQRQYKFLVHGAKIQKEIRVATLGNGIQKLSSEQVIASLKCFSKEKENHTWMKFVPASGAASRMFAPFYTFYEASLAPNFNFKEYCNSEEGYMVKKLFKELKKLPFYALAYAIIIQDYSIPLNNDKEFFEAFVSVVLNEKGLDLPNMPKALIPFFVDDQGRQWTAFEAQLLEVLKLGHQNQSIPIHLTIDEKYRAAFESIESEFREKLSKNQIKNLTVEYSYQHSHTDTPYLNHKNEWVRDKEGRIAFRKGGHGALLQNLNRLEADFIWIKNIDNILLNESNIDGEKWMKILGGHLVSIQKQLFAHLRELERNNFQLNYEPITSFIQTHFDPDFKLSSQEKLANEVLYNYLDRPIRICGMIPNEGAKGGGPFWKFDERGKSLQIIEGVEFNLNNDVHLQAIDKSSHFNPVMMVCGITNHKGEKFSLYDFRDETGFMVSKKTMGTSKIKILEWPGLWNGGMAAWNTLFVEVPSETFHPVKTIADLIR